MAKNVQGIFITCVSGQPINSIWHLCCDFLSRCLMANNGNTGRAPLWLCWHPRLSWGVTVIPVFNGLKSNLNHQVVTTSLWKALQINLHTAAAFHWTDQQLFSHWIISSSDWLSDSFCNGHHLKSHYSSHFCFMTTVLCLKLVQV